MSVRATITRLGGLGLAVGVLAVAAGAAPAQAAPIEPAVPQPAAVPGLVRVVATSPSNSLNKSVTATCPAGKRVYSAGGQITGGLGNVYMDEQKYAKAGPSFERALAVAEKVLPKGTTLFVGCLSGKRSETACQLLDQAGYTNVANVAGGFGGAKDMMGRVIQPGWSALGLPVSNDDGEGVSYASLRRKAIG